MERNIRKELYLNQNLPFHVLSEKQCAQLYGATLALLEHTGVNVFHEESLAVLKRAGCRVDGNHVRIPTRVVEWAVRTAPTRITMFDREGSPAMHLEGANSYYGAGPTCPNFRDIYTGERRESRKSDVEKTAKLCDALPNIDFVMSLCMISDTRAEAADVHEMQAMLQNSSKPIVGWAFTPESNMELCEMAATVAGGWDKLAEKPFLVMYSEPTTPLTHSKESLAKMLFCAEKGIPILYTPGMLIGAASPISLPGSCSVGLAENLTGLVLAQLKNEGCPFIGASCGSPMSMKTMQCMYGAPEMPLELMLSTDVLRYIGLPTFSTAGVTDAKVVDQQAAIEATSQIMCSMLSGANLIHDCGFTDSGMTGSLECLVMCDEIISYVRSLFRPIEINEMTLAIDAIDEVGPGGNFLTHDHTLDNYQKEQWESSLMDHQLYKDWESQGSKTMGQRAVEKAQSLLETHTVKPLDAAILAKLDAIVEKNEKRLAAQ